jgi:hypothetical protein
VLSSKDFLGSVRQTIGVSAFNDLLAMQGQVTLMFAIDDTGSMTQEIAAAKKIATSMVDEQRAEPVDYILSPFNDPGNQLWLASCLKTVLCSKCNFCKKDNLPPPPLPCFPVAPVTPTPLCVLRGNYSRKY